MHPCSEIEPAVAAAIAGYRLHRVIGGASGHIALDSVLYAYFARANEITVVATYDDSPGDAQRAGDAVRAAIIDACGGRLIDVTLNALQQQSGAEMQLTMRKAALGFGRVPGIAGSRFDFVSVVLSPDSLTDTDAAMKSLRAANDVTSASWSASWEVLAAAARRAEALGESVRALRVPAAYVGPPAWASAVTATATTTTITSMASPRAHSACLDLLPASLLAAALSLGSEDRALGDDDIQRLPLEDTPARPIAATSVAAAPARSVAATGVALVKRAELVTEDVQAGSHPSTAPSAAVTSAREALAAAAPTTTTPSPAAARPLIAAASTATTPSPAAARPLVAVAALLPSTTGRDAAPATTAPPTTAPISAPSLSPAVEVARPTLTPAPAVEVARPAPTAAADPAVAAATATGMPSPSSVQALSVASPAATGAATAVVREAPFPSSAAVQVRLLCAVSETVSVEGRCSGGPETVAISGTIAVSAAYPPATSSAGHPALPFAVMLKCGAPLASLSVSPPPSSSNGSGNVVAVPVPTPPVATPPAPGATATAAGAPAAAAVPVIVRVPLTLPARTGITAAATAGSATPIPIAIISYTVHASFQPPVFRAQATSRPVLQVVSQAEAAALRTAPASDVDAVPSPADIVNLQRHAATDVTVKSVIHGSLSALRVSGAQLLVQLPQQPALPATTMQSSTGTGAAPSTYSAAVQTRPPAAWAAPPRAQLLWTVLDDAVPPPPGTVDDGGPASPARVRTHCVAGRPAEFRARVPIVGGGVVAADAAATAAAAPATVLPLQVRLTWAVGSVVAVSVAAPSADVVAAGAMSSSTSRDGTASPATEAVAVVGVAGKVQSRLVVTYR